ncbi:MAG: efflux RND transporter permease subunit [Acidobacteria bacterium]|nr:efflux RND transporter permease subunit [Acidobacteriota bacterium]
MKIVDLSIRRPVTVIVFSAAAIVFGVVAFKHLAVDLLPNITYPSLTVKTEYPGTAPAEVESLLTRPIENAVGVVNNVVRVTSSSRADVSEVTLEFAWGTDMDFAALDVRERLDVVRLPPEAERPILLRYDPKLDPIMKIALYGSDDLARLRFIADERVKRELERVEGVAGVLVSGGLEEEIQVELDERRLANLGLTAEQVRSRLAAENVNLTGGTLREGETEYLVRTLNEFKRPADIQRIVIQRSGDTIIRLEDVARVFTGHKERDIITHVNGHESVELALYKEGGTNTVTVSDAVKARLGTLRKELIASNPNLRLEIVTDQAHYIRQSVQQVLKSAVYGGILAVIVLFFFLRSVKKTAIISLSIPVSVVATFFLMYLTGISLNVMSLGGLALGVGLLVDNGIVVLEAVQRRSEDGLDEVTAAREGTSEVARAITASTLTTICVFVPIIFVEGVAAQLFRDQAITVACSLVVSLVVALTVVPMLASRRLHLDQPIEEEEPGYGGSFFLTRWVGGVVLLVSVGVLKGAKLLVGWLSRLLGRLMKPFLDLFDTGLAALRATYERVITVVLRHPVMTVTITALCLVGSLGLYRQLGSELIPELVQGELYVDISMPPGTRLEVTQRQLGELEGYARTLPGVRTVYSIAGASGEQGGSAGEIRENIGQLTITLDPPISRPREEAVMTALREHLDRENLVLRETALTDNQNGDEPVIAYRFGRPSYFSFKTAIELEIRGENLALLKRLAAEAMSRMRSVSGLADVKSSTEGGYPELQIRFDRDRLAAFGFTVAQVAEKIRTKVEGDIATDITRTDRTIDIRVRDQERYRDSARDLANLNVAETGTTSIPLSAVADVLTTEGPAEIRRGDGSRVALITANLAGRDLGSVSKDIETTLKGMTWPEGYDWRLGGQEQEMKTSFGSMGLAFGLAVFMVYLVMASQFESLLHPFVILFSVPFAVIGAFVAMYLFNVTVSVVSLIGLVLLAGIAVNDAIVKIDYTNQLRRDGMEKIEALKRAGLVRLRPILMTSATTVLGLLPMAVGLGEGAELRVPMALTVIGGMLTATFLTLLVVPAVYTILDRSR